MTDPAAPDPATTVPAGTCPFTIDRAIMLQRWDRLAFLHWSFDPPAVQRLLPRGLTVEPFEDRAWVGLVPFFMRVSTGGGRNVPWASNFCETNVRTYVRDEQGQSGIWFFSLDAARLGAVIVARTTYRLPYFWSDMDIAIDATSARYESVRRWPGPRGARCRVHLALGDPYEAHELTERDHFLTARWMLFSSTARQRQRFARAWHDPWPVVRAEAVDVHDELLRAAGLPATDDAPLVHWSPGVDVRIGLPERYR